MMAAQIDGNPGPRLTQLLDDRAFHQVATLALEAYGAELYGFLIHTMRSSSEVDEVFSQTVEAFWRGLPRFEARCSVRTWLYLLAKHAAVNHQRSPWNGDRRAGYVDLDA